MVDMANEDAPQLFCACGAGNIFFLFLQLSLSLSLSLSLKQQVPRCSFFYFFFIFFWLLSRLLTHSCTPTYRPSLVGAHAPPRAGGQPACRIRPAWRAHRCVDRQAAC